MQFKSNAISEHNEAPLPNDGQWEELVAHWRARQPRARLSARPTEEQDGNACYVVSIRIHGTPTPASPTSSDAQLREIVTLVRSQGDRVVGQQTLGIRRLDPRTMLPKGAHQTIAAHAEACGATVLVLDAELTPSQQRNLEEATGLAVCDRESVILNVFQRNARTRRARIQVEIAQLSYLRPRIRGLGLNMDQQAGGVMRGRGPGETASELLARQLDHRLSELRKAWARMGQAASARRSGRSNCTRIALVGYTNAGKTTLMNALTHAGLSARDRPFETLDATTRCLTRHGGDVLLSDTVGVIRRLPERLLASFDSTLSELREASLLVVVVDASDPEWPMHLDTTDALLERIGADHLPRFHVFNKVDRVSGPDAIADLTPDHAGVGTMSMSGLDAAAVATLKDRLIALSRGGQRTSTLVVAYGDADTLSLAYRTCRVLETEADDAGLRVTLTGTGPAIERIRRACGAVTA